MREKFRISVGILSDFWNIEILFMLTNDLPISKNNNCLFCRFCELWQSRFIPSGHSVNERFSDRNETTEGSTETIQKWQQAILSAFTLKWTWFEIVFLVSWVRHWKSSNACPTLNPFLLFLHSCLPFLHIFFLKNIAKEKEKQHAKLRLFG